MWTLLKSLEMDGRCRILTEEDNGDVRIYDGAKITNNCSSVTDLRWSYIWCIYGWLCLFVQLYR